jgi:hypothetical protein
MIRRTITLLLLAVAFWWGMSFERLRTEQACKSNGGTLSPDGRLCVVAGP